MLSEEDCWVGSKHPSILTISLEHFVALCEAGKRLGCTHYRRAKCYVDVVLLMSDFEVHGNTGSLDVDTVAAAMVAVQPAGNNGQAVSAGSKQACKAVD